MITGGLGEFEHEEGEGGWWKREVGVDTGGSCAHCILYPFPECPFHFLDLYQLNTLVHAQISHKVQNVA